jgi:hypothetical protein
MVFQQLTPGTVAGGRRLGGGANDVGEQHRGKHALWLRVSPPAGIPYLRQERFDLIGDQHRGVAAQREMTRGRNLGDT